MTPCVCAESFFSFNFLCRKVVEPFARCTRVVVAADVPHALVPPPPTFKCDITRNITNGAVGNLSVRGGVPQVSILDTPTFDLKSLTACDIWYTCRQNHSL